MDLSVNSACIYFLYQFGSGSLVVEKTCVFHLWAYSQRCSDAYSTLCINYALSLVIRRGGCSYEKFENLICVRAPPVLGYFKSTVNRHSARILLYLERL